MNCENKTANYKIVASDLDGTLLNSVSEVSLENLEAIASLTEKGVYFVPATGRTISEIPETIRDNPAVRYIIHSSGAAVYDKKSGERISFCIDNALARKVFTAILKYECHISVRIGGKILTGTEMKTPESYAYNQVWSVHSELLDEIAENIPDIKSKLLDMDGVEMISLFFHDDEDVERLSEELRAIGSLNLARAWEHNLEITYVDAGKGNALAALAEKLSLSMSETLAVGDSGNDAPMIEMAGLGLAVSNATDSLKKIADGVICSNDEHAIKYVLEEYF